MEDSIAPIELEANSSNNFFDFATSDITHLILSQLPIPSIIRCSAVCKLWRSITTSPSFSPTSAALTTPWFFLYGQNNISFRSNRLFVFDPYSNEWIKLFSNLFPVPFSLDSSFIVDGGFFFYTTLNSFSFSPILKPSWRETTPLRFPRLNPLVGVINSAFSSNLNLDNNSFESNFDFPKIIVVGGVESVGGLIDFEDDLPVEIYNPDLNSWELCPPLPSDFRSGNSSQSLSSALFKSKFYVYDSYSCFISSFDLNNRVWSEVQKLRPPGVNVSFLVCCRNQLMLAGFCNERCEASFNVWRIDESMEEFSEVGIMPRDLLNYLFDNDDDDDTFGSLECFGFGNFIFVLNADRRRDYPACVCEISSGSDDCRWRRVPELPEPVNRFHKVGGFCSTVSLHPILKGGFA